MAGPGFSALCEKKISYSRELVLSQWAVVGLDVVDKDLCVLQ